MSTDSNASSQTSGPPRRGSIRSLTGPVIGGILVVVGIGLFAEYLGMHIPDRWSALLLLIPAAGCLAAAGSRYRTLGQTLDGNIVGLLLGAAVFAGLFVMVFFNLDEKLYGPLLLIGIGGGILARHYWPRGTDQR